MVHFFFKAIVCCIIVLLFLLMTNQFELINATRLTTKSLPSNNLDTSSKQPTIKIQESLPLTSLLTQSISGTEIVNQEVTKVAVLFKLHSLVSERQTPPLQIERKSLIYARPCLFVCKSGPVCKRSTRSTSQ
jgi:hypothetical protein